MPWSGVTRRQGGRLCHLVTLRPRKFSAILLDIVSGQTSTPGYSFLYSGPIMHSMKQHGNLGVTCLPIWSCNISLLHWVLYRFPDTANSSLFSRRIRISGRRSTIIHKVTTSIIIDRYANFNGSVVSLVVSVIHIEHWGDGDPQMHCIPESLIFGPHV